MLARKHPDTQVMLTVLLEVADPGLQHQPWGATASPALVGENNRGKTVSVSDQSGAVHSAPSSPKRLQRNPHQLDTLSGMPEMSLTDSAVQAGATGLGQQAGMIQITLHDRIAFASRFLPDDDFVAFVIRIRQDCLEGGRVDGLLITGPSPTGAWLLQRYLDNTGDVQTAAIAGCFLLRAIEVCHAAYFLQYIVV